MKFSFALIGVLFIAGSVLAQAPAETAQHQQPGLPAHTPGQTARKSPADTNSKTDPAKEAAIRHLMEITDTSKLGDNIATYLKGQVHDGVGRAIGNDKLEAFMTSFNEKFTATSPGPSVTEAMIGIYANAFSMEDIQGLIQFYESPLGQRVVKALPDVVTKSQQAGIEIEQASALKILREMSADYPELKQVLPAEGASPNQGATPGPESTPPPSTAPKPAPAPPSK